MKTQNPQDQKGHKKKDFVDKEGVNWRGGMTKSSFYMYEIVRE